MRRALLALVLLAGCGGGADIPTTCNGYEALCGRRYDQVVYPTTHNSMSNADDKWVRPDQHHNIKRQLEDGIRGLMLDIWYDPLAADATEVYLCHGVCRLGEKPLVDGLKDIGQFLDQHRGEVVTIIFESYVDPADVAKAFEAAGVMHLVYTPPGPTAPWPTLREMIDADTRLVVMTDNGGGAYPWYLDQWAYAWQNPYAAESAADFSCAVDRGSADNPVFIMNNFLSKPLADPTLADMVNHDPFLVERARQCMAEEGRLPNFLTVDFYDIGDLFEAVRELNGV